EELVASLVRQRRQARPAPEDITVPPSMRPRAPQPPREHRPRHEHHEQRAPRPERAERPERTERVERPEPASRGVWFTINVGRYKNADPKWLVPLLCRRGQITKHDIGKIQINARTTRVEIAPDVSARFAVEAAKPDPKDANIRIVADAS